MVVLPHAIEINDFEHALRAVIQALNIRDPQPPPSTDWPDDPNGRLATIQAWLNAEINALAIPRAPAAEVSSEA